MGAHVWESTPITMETRQELGAQRSGLDFQADAVLSEATWSNFPNRKSGKHEGGGQAPRPKLLQKEGLAAKLGAWCVWRRGREGQSRDPTVSQGARPFPGAWGAGGSWVQPFLAPEGRAVRKTFWKKGWKLQQRPLLPQEPVLPAGLSLQLREPLWDPLRPPMTCHEGRPGGLTGKEAGGELQRQQCWGLGGNEVMQHPVPSLCPHPCPLPHPESSPVPGGGRGRGCCGCFMSRQRFRKQKGNVKGTVAPSAVASARQGRMVPPNERSCLPPRPGRPLTWPCPPCTAAPGAHVARGHLHTELVTGQRAEHFHPWLSGPGSPPPFLTANRENVLSRPLPGVGG